MPSITVEDKDYGFQRIVVDTQALRGRSIRIGFWGDDTIEGTSVVDYATYNEFGTRHIPSRPFMATTYDQNKRKIYEFIESLVGQIIDGKSSPDRVLKVLGEWYANQVKLTIRNAVNWAVPLKEETIERKGSTSPLIDTGRMINAVNYEVK